MEKRGKIKINIYLPELLLKIFNGTSSIPVVAQNICPRSIFLKALNCPNDNKINIRLLLTSQKHNDYF